jgi:hypothetical protein
MDSLRKLPIRVTCSYHETSQEEEIVKTSLGGKEKRGTVIVPLPS